MKILNVMLSRDLGGIQQSFLDYNEALNLINSKVINIISINSKISSKIKDRRYSLLNLSSFDPLSYLQIKYIILKEKPDIIIAHGNRAIKYCLNNDVRVIGVAHNYNMKWLPKCDYVFATTLHLKNYLLEQGFGHDKIMVLPNMISIQKNRESGSYHQKFETVVIGAMGRFVKKKGFDIFLIALSILKSRNINFKAIIAGEGEEEDHLKRLAVKLGLSNDVKFVGWVLDKDEFFRQIDIFCLPSTHEPFGIILLEAMARFKAIVSTRSEGPSEIIENNKTGLLCDLTAVDLAEKLQTLLKNPDLTSELAKNAFLGVKQQYDIEVVSKILASHLKHIFELNKNMQT